jgi:hypothetical protein
MAYLLHQILLAILELKYADMLSDFVSPVCVHFVRVMVSVCYIY